MREQAEVAAQDEQATKAWESTYSAAALQRLISLWQRRADALAPYAPPAAEAWRAAAEELQAKLHVPPFETVVRQLISTLGREVLLELRSVITTSPDGCGGSEGECRP